MKSDIFSLLNDDADTLPTDKGLTTISLWKAVTYYVMFFTLHPGRFASHRDDEKKIIYLCPGEGCPACSAGVRASEHVYLPVWDVENRRVTVLKFDTRPDGPARKVLAFLKTYRDQLADVVAVIDCKGDGNGTFTITAHTPLPETDRGALACRAFCDGLEVGAIDLSDCVKRLTVEEITALPSVERRAVRLVGSPVAPAVAASGTVGDPVAPNPRPDGSSSEITATSVEGPAPPAPVIAESQRTVTDDEESHS
jgi:hypothetical protein